MKTVWRVKKDGKYIRVNKNGDYSFDDTGDNRIATFTNKKAYEVLRKFGGKIEKGIG